MEPPAPADKPETEKQKQPMQEDHEVEDEMVDVVVDEGEGRVPAVPEEEMFQDYLVRPTSIRRPREEDGEGRVPEEDGEGRVPEEDGEGRVPEEDELMEDQYHFATANSGPPSSWVQIHVFDEENADRVDSQATTRRLGEHLNDDEGEDQPMPAIPRRCPPGQEVEDPVVNKVLQEMKTMGIERRRRLRLCQCLSLESLSCKRRSTSEPATGPEGRVPRGQNKIFREETAEEATLRSVAGEDSNMHKDSDPVEGCVASALGHACRSRCQKGGSSTQLQQAAVQQHDGHRSDAAADGSPRNHDPRGRPE